MLKLLKYIIVFLTVLMPRSRKIFVCGAWFGKRFSDNSRVLFLELQEQKGVKAVWVSSEREVIEEVRSLGCKAYNMYSPVGIFWQLIAGYAVVTNGISDVNHTVMGGARFINLWHGVPLKKIGYDDTYSCNRKNLFVRMKKSIHRAAFGQEYLSVTAPVFIKIYMSAFGVDEPYVVLGGQPRNDLFTIKPTPGSALDRMIRRENEKPLMKVIDEARTEGKKILLYAPTHRQEGAHQQDIAALLDPERLDAILKEKNALLIVNRHYYHSDEADALKGYENIYDATSAQLDTQLLLMRTDILITDYSSIYVDFLLLDRPIIFYAYDKEEYLAGDRETYFDYDVFTPGLKPMNSDELAKAIVLAIDGKSDLEGSPEDYATVRHNLIRLFYIKQLHGVCGPELLEMVNEVEEQRLRGEI